MKLLFISQMNNTIHYVLRTLGIISTFINIVWISNYKHNHQASSQLAGITNVFLLFKAISSFKIASFLNYYLSNIEELAQVWKCIYLCPGLTVS